MTGPEGNNKLCVPSTLQHILRELCLFPLGPEYLGGVGGGGHYRIWAIQGCAALKGMVFKQFTLG